MEMVQKLGTEGTKDFFPINISPRITFRGVKSSRRHSIGTSMKFVVVAPNEKRDCDALSDATKDTFKRVRLRRRWWRDSENGQKESKKERGEWGRCKKNGVSRLTLEFAFLHRAARCHSGIYRETITIKSG